MYGVESLKHAQSLSIGRRIAAFDYGKKRIGWAVCDEFHITCTPKGIFEATSPTLLPSINQTLQNEKIGLCVVGMPIRLDEQSTKLMKEIEKFMVDLYDISSIPVVSFDESYSSKNAVSVMIDIGVKKHKRRDKSRVDTVSAALILRDFLNEL